ncbi:hypothetical protein [Spirosoma humi]
MNWLRFLILGTGTLSGQWVDAQCRILYRSQELVVQPDQYVAIIPDTAAQITAIESRGVLSKYLLVHYAHAKRKLLLKSSIWGFVDSRQAVWRSYNKELFLVLNYNSSWVEYAIERPVGTRLSATYPAVMYSRTLDSEIKSTWNDAIKDVSPGYIVR